MPDNFAFIIARLWDDQITGSEDFENMCIYTFHNSDIQFGDMQKAEECLAYVKNIGDPGYKEEYNIYRINYELVKR